MRILYIGCVPTHSTGGADVVNKRNYTLLMEISKGKLDVIEPKIDSLLDKSYFGISSLTIKKINEELSLKEFTHVFISQSLYGRAVKFIRQKFSYIPIITFCHNIEIDYAKSYLKTNGLKALPFYLMVKKWEKEALKNSSYIITLNSRDSLRLKMVYGKDAAMELQTSFDDMFDENKAKKVIERTNLLKIDYLFVGVSFFANVQGCQWFIDNVMPHVDGDFYIVGKGMDKIQFKNLNDKIHVKGFVDDLSEYYYSAKIVVSPIFTGAGMKTKTAEALMYGKTIVGTSEAFVGYEMREDVMYEANDSLSFINTINKIEQSTNSVINRSAREVFLRNHESKTLINKLRNLLL